MIILGIDTSKLNWYLILYVVLSIVFLGFGTNTVYSTGQVRGIIFGIGSALVLVYFGLKWFANPVVAATDWPPVINMCPDYLTYIPNINISSTPPAATAGTAATAATTQGGCVDMLGISSNGGFKKTTTSALPNLTITDNTSSGSIAYKVFKYTYERVKSAISDGSSNKGTATEPKGSAVIQQICNACKDAGLTWEGVYDGSTCTALNSFNLISARTPPGCVNPT